MCAIAVCVTTWSSDVIHRDSQEYCIHHGKMRLVFGMWRKLRKRDYHYDKK